MQTKILTILFGLAAVALPAVAPASQTAARLADGQLPARAQLTDAAFRMLLADPAAAQPLSVVLPLRFTTLEPAGATF